LTLPREIAQVLAGERQWHVEQGDCLDVLRLLPDNCVDALCCDPPAGINFMQKDFDSDRGGRDQWIAWLTERMREALRVMKPGAHGLVWSLPRTSHWTGMALELAGWQPRDVIAHLTGSGFPKSADLSKAADKHLGAKRPVVGKHPHPGSTNARLAMGDGWKAEPELTAPATAAAAAALQGVGTALKPAAEYWWLVRKPVRGTVIANVLEHGTGGLNIDACRVPHASAADLEQHAAGVAAIKARGGSMDNSWKNSSDLSGANDVTAAGRWPANVCLSHSPGCELVGTKKVKASPSWNDNRGPSLFTGGETSPVHHADDDGFEVVEDWRCEEGCPVKELDEQSTAHGMHSAGSRQGPQEKWADAKNNIYGGGVGSGPNGARYGDDGGASRFFRTFAPFFYTPKASRSDREKGLEHLPRKSGADLTGSKEGAARLQSPRTGAGRGGGRANDHPTVKSDELMRYLCRLITPRGGIVLDIYTGSGSTGKAALAEGFRFIGVEIDSHYCEIARARIEGDMPLLNRQVAT
jgi:DNA modification methylase